LRGQNQRLRDLLKAKALEQNDFLLDIDESMLRDLDESVSPH